MKKISVLAMMFVALSLPVTFVSCGDDDPTETAGGDGGAGGGGDDEPGGGDDEPGGGDDEPGGGSGNQILDLDQQKAELKNTANELMGMFRAADFNRISDLGHYVDNNTDDGSVVEDWWESCVDACEMPAAGNDIMNLYRASNFYGQFELRNGRWQQTASDVNYLEFRVTDASGQLCVLHLECSGQETTIHHEEFDDEDWYYYYDNGNYYSVVTRIENRFVIPERINITLTQGSETLASVMVNTNLTLQSADGEFNYKTDRADVSAQVSAADYTVTVDRVMFNAGRDAEVQAVLSKGGMTLLTVSATANGNLDNDDDLQGSIPTVNLDILGRVRLGGTISDVDELATAMDEADNNSYNEAAFRAALDRANGYIDMGLYFNGNGSPSANVILYPFYEDDYYYGTEWYYEPAIMFSDGSSYSLATYFDEEYYDSVITQFTDLVNSFIHLVDAGENVDW